MTNQRRSPWRHRLFVWLGWTILAGTIGHLELAAAAAEGSVAEEKFEVLSTASQVYSNVTVVSKSRNQISIMHAGGVTSIKLEDLGPDVQAKLGYDLTRSSRKAKSLSLPKSFSAHAEQVREARAKLEELIRQYGSTAGLGLAIGLPSLYLFCCLCFLQVCRKAGVNAPVKVWIPLLQLDPLFKAADMSRIALFWFLSPLLFAVCVFGAGLAAVLSGASPEVFKAPKLLVGLGGLQALLSFASLMVGFAWCFKICIARGKSSWLGVFLILPLTNLLMLCYLAFSRGVREKQKTGAALRFV